MAGAGTPSSEADTHCRRVPHAEAAGAQLLLGRGHGERGGGGPGLLLGGCGGPPPRLVLAPLYLQDEAGGGGPGAGAGHTSHRGLQGF